MTTVISSKDFSSFCASHRVEGWKRNHGHGTVEVRWTEPFVDDPEQRRFDEWELSQPPMFSTDYGFWKMWQSKKVVPKKSGQPELGW